MSVITFSISSYSDDDESNISSRITSYSRSSLSSSSRHRDGDMLGSRNPEAKHSTSLVDARKPIS